MAQPLGGTASTIAKFGTIISTPTYHSPNSKVGGAGDTVVCLASVQVLRRYAGSQRRQEAALDALPSFECHVLPSLRTKTQTKLTNSFGSKLSFKCSEFGLVHVCHKLYLFSFLVLVAQKSSCSHYSFHACLRYFPCKQSMILSYM